MTNQPLVFIDGDQGTTGLQIHQRLHGRTDLQVLTLPESDRKNPTRRAEAINSCDIAILCLPDAAAREAVAAIHNPAVRVIDASSAHRTDAQWVYGFPEMDAAQAARIASAQRVSNCRSVRPCRRWWICRPVVPWSPSIKTRGWLVMVRIPGMGGCGIFGAGLNFE